MANPLRIIANMPKNPGTYRAFSSMLEAGAFERAAKAAGYKVRRSRYKIGPRGPRITWMEKVTVYWTDAQPAPDMDAFAVAARAEVAARTGA